MPGNQKKRMLKKSRVVGEILLADLHPLLLLPPDRTLAKSPRQLEIGEVGGDPGRGRRGWWLASGLLLANPPQGRSRPYETPWATKWLSFWGKGFRETVGFVKLWSPFHFSV